MSSAEREDFVDPSGEDETLRKVISDELQPTKLCSNTIRHLMVDLALLSANRFNLRNKLSLTNSNMLISLD